MSRLAAVHTGQPTQGIGASPARTVKPVPTRQYASPLEAQRAEADAAEALAADLEALNHNDPTSDANQGHGGPAPARVNPRDPYSAARAATTAAWLSLSATELEVRKYFRSISVQSGMEELAKMRHQCDLAAETLQGRIDEGSQERCSGCGKTLEEARKSQWLMQGSEVDSDTGVPMPYRYCGPQCIRKRNRDKMLPPEERNKLRFDGQEEGDIR